MRAILEITGEQFEASRNVLMGTSCLRSVISFLGGWGVGPVDGMDGRVCFIGTTKIYTEKSMSIKH